RALRRQRPGAVVVMSVWTETGREVALASGADGAFYLPIDFPWVIRRALRALRPALICSVDTELWPNLVAYGRRSGARVALANGRISDRSLRRIRNTRLHWFYRPMTASVERLLMQTPLDAERILELGGRPEAVQVCGNVKFDEEFPVVDAARLAHWRGLLGLDPAAPVLLAGSTTHGEDELLVEVYRRLRKRHPEARLVLVPRGVETAPAIAAIVRGLGEPTVLRSQLPGRSAESRAEGAVIVVDTLGELSELYAVATVAFVGRTLMPKGGSNVLQPAAQGKPVVVGPHVSNFRESVALLQQAGVLWQVTDADQLAERVLALVDDRATLAAVNERARAAVEANRGAAARTVAALLELLDGRPV
ncbi:MAG: glycosyltransferase, partial [Rubrivivax sp.]|nr:glycosyltransferase [Rubrivivax sp.]